ncbi:MAG TPA: hypothetical protein VE242_12640 [Chthoniobacterales bacterium]|nr:hypothetical protein [Chthoniobacterales bacterium]
MRRCRFEILERFFTVGTALFLGDLHLSAQTTLAAPPPLEPERSFIWQNWTDRRPIGQLILAGRDKSTPQNPGKWNLDGVDVTSAAGQANFRTRMLNYAQATARNILSVRGQGVIIWDIEGQRYGELNYVGDPRLLPVLAPEMEPLADRLFEVFRRHGLKVGVCLRADTIALQPDGLPVPRTHQSYYTSRDQAVADLDAKIGYAKNRWGRTIFYIDSNGDGGRYIGEKDHAGIYPASIYRELYRRHPDCLICPEEYYNNGDGGLNDSYSPITAPYQELRVSSPSVGGVTDYPPGTRDHFPGAFMLVQISDGDVRGKRTKLMAGVRAGNILLFRAWFASHDMADVVEIMKAETADH